MFVLSIVFLVLLAAPSGQSGMPRYIQGRWVIPDETLQYEDDGGNILTLEESIWPDVPSGEVEKVMLEGNLQTTSESYVMREQDDDEESAAWKIVLVVSILLVSVVGSLSVAYYLCIWRGGRIHYEQQKQIYT